MDDIRLIAGSRYHYYVSRCRRRNNGYCPCSDAAICSSIIDMIGEIIGTVEILVRYVSKISAICIYRQYAVCWDRIHDYMQSIAIDIICIERA